MNYNQIHFGLKIVFLGQGQGYFGLFALLLLIIYTPSVLSGTCMVILCCLKISYSSSLLNKTIFIHNVFPQYYPCKCQQLFSHFLSYCFHGTSNRKMHDHSKDKQPYVQKQGVKKHNLRKNVHWTKFWRMDINFIYILRTAIISMVIKTLQELQNWQRKAWLKESFGQFWLVLVSFGW